MNCVFVNYFVNVTDNSKLKINYKVEDSSAKVSVTGNDNIKEGTNKILIAVFLVFFSQKQLSSKFFTCNKSNDYYVQIL